MEDKIFNILDTLDAMNNPQEALRVHFKFPETVAIARAFAAEVEDCAKKSDNSEELLLAAGFFNSITPDTVLPETGNLSDNYVKVTVTSNNSCLSVLSGLAIKTRQGYTSIEYNSQGNIVTKHSMALQDLFLTHSLNLYKYSNFEFMYQLLQQQISLHPEKVVFVAVLQALMQCEEYLKEHCGELVLNMYEDTALTGDAIYFNENSETQHVAELYIGGN